jgi:hypothetical protein
MNEQKDKEIALCYIHKIAMQKIEHVEYDPKFEKHCYIEYKCPMCVTSIRED